MPEEWFEIAAINFDKLILYGRATAGTDLYGCRIEIEVEQVLTEPQKAAYEALAIKHRMEMDRLLSGFVDRTRKEPPHAE